MRSTATSNDRGPYVVPRPVVLRSTLSSLQAAVASNDMSRLSPFRGGYSPSQGEPMIQQKTEGDDWQRYSPQPASSLQAAVRHSGPSAFSAATKDEYLSPSKHHQYSYAPTTFRPTLQHHQSQFAPISSREYLSPSPTKVKPVRTSFSICIDPDKQDDSTKNPKDEEEDYSWNPPVPHAVICSKEEDVYSPLTVPSRASPPGFPERRSNAFVPIREWSLSAAPSAWEPKQRVEENHWSDHKVHHHYQGEDDEEEELWSRTFERYGTSSHAFSSPSPYRMESPAATKYSYQKPSPYSAESPATYIYRKPSPFYCGVRSMAPSPAFTAETADLTLDSLASPPPSSAADTHYLRNERFLQAIGSPPLYRPRSSVALAATRPTTERPHSAPTVGRPVLVKPKEPPDDVQQRKCRLKTELCMHYESGRPCPFGANCTYAHGEEELQMTKLLDLHNAGLVDMTTHRTKPCLTWIATGSCPFGKRCTGIHDYRVGSSASQSWLPHTETQGNTIATDINVDALHQKRLHTILYDNPFGDQFFLTPPPMSNTAVASTPSNWEDLYRLVCGGGMEMGSRGGGIKSTRQGWIAGGSKRGSYRQVHPIYKLQIALKLRGADANWQYKYRPQHVVHEELCMVLQKRAFRVISNEHGDSGRKGDTLHGKPPLSMSTATAISSVAEIPLALYNPQLANHILVHELAFGPDCDPSIRGVALWFNIVESDVTVCTPQQAKRFRWKKNGVNPVTPLSGYNATGNAPVKPSMFDSGTIDSFPMIRPHDDSAFRLVTDMMKHRLAVLKRERLSNMKERFDALQKLQRQEDWLKERFVNHRRSWLHWAWPVNRGRLHVDENTPVPPVEGPYIISVTGTNAKGKKQEPSDDENADPNGGTDTDSAPDSDTVELGKNVRRIWESFVSCLENSNHVDGANDLGSRPGSKQLPVFNLLSQGKALNTNRNLPHILRSPFQDRDENGGKDSDNQSERCWKALLLPTPPSEEPNEWEIVREHFENSRSKKVLSIIQQ